MYEINNIIIIIILNYASLVISTVAILVKFKMVARYHVDSIWY